MEAESQVWPGTGWGCGLAPGGGVAWHQVGSTASSSQLRTRTEWRLDGSRALTRSLGTSPSILCSSVSIQT